VIQIIVNLIKYQKWY